MTTTPHITRQASNFGLMQVFALGTIVLFGALLAVPMRLVPQVLTPASASTLDHGLWAVEVLLYLGIAWMLSRKALPTLYGVLVGLAVRFITGILISVLLHHPGPLTAQFQIDLWLVHLLIIVTVSLGLLLPLRGIITAGFTTAGAVVNGKKPQQFYFTKKPAQTSSFKIRSTNSKPEEPVEIDYLMPPDDFSPIFPRDDIFGMANVPAKVVLESIPEAEGIIKADGVVRIRLAYLVPQLNRSTLWLTWQQIFAKGASDGALTGAEFTETEFRDRWVRLPAKYYVTQVPREYYTGTKTPPSWLRLSEVPQEHNLKFE